MWGRARSQTSPASAPAPGVFGLTLAETPGLGFMRAFIFVLIHLHTFTVATVLGPKNPLLGQVSVCSPVCDLVGRQLGKRGTPSGRRSRCIEPRQQRLVHVQGMLEVAVPSGSVLGRGLAGKLGRAADPGPTGLGCRSMELGCFPEANEEATVRLWCSLWFGLCVLLFCFCFAWLTYFPVDAVWNRVLCEYICRRSIPNTELLPISTHVLLNVYFLIMLTIYLLG